ncbi:MAG: 4Fe-4S cluster-binding domain-containing protein, partial [Pseudomonadota bacterium]
MKTETILPKLPISKTSSNSINMARLAYPVTALGPGRRVVLWVAGCSLRCKDCITPELLDSEQGRIIE